MGNKENGSLFVVKIGTDTLTQDGRVDAFYAADMAAQVAEVRESGSDTVLISSGAVALGGQEKLTSAWENAFAPHGIVVAETLIGEETIDSGTDAIRLALREARLPLINGDHVASLGERTRSNDTLAAEIATRLGAPAIFLTNVDGVLTPEGRVMPLLRGIENVVFMGKSKGGTGGMESKVRAARRVAETGQTALIAHGRRPQVLVDFAAGRNGFGTTVT